MHKHRVREWILSLVTTPERAASIVGDMVEDECTTFRCWTAIASHLAHAITPGVIGLVLTGFFAQFLLSLTAAIALNIGFRFLAWPVDAKQWQILYWGIVPAFLGIQFLTGYGIAYLDQRRALLLGLAVMLLDCIAGALNVNNASINMAIWSIPLMAGTLLYRRHTRHRSA
jgi:hypothetical protein